MEERKKIFFGTYFYSENGEKKPVEWIVLEETQQDMLLISLYGLEAIAFDSNSNNWEPSSLRAWLNGDFKKEAFAKAEQSKIQGDITILDIDEVRKYFGETADQLKPTPYAAARGAFISRDDGSTWWWLRSQGAQPNMAAFVYNDGTLFPDGSLVSRDNGAVRPVIRIKK